MSNNPESKKMEAWKAAIPDDKCVCGFPFSIILNGVETCSICDGVKEGEVKRDVFSAMPPIVPNMSNFPQQRPFPCPHNKFDNDVASGHGWLCTMCHEEPYFYDEYGNPATSAPLPLSEREREEQQPKPLNIYLLSQSVETGYDTYDSCVVIAEDEDKARYIHPSKFVTHHNGRAWMGTYAETAMRNPGGEYENESSDWVPYSCISQITVTLIGTAAEGQSAGLVLASFNAG